MGGFCSVMKFDNEKKSFDEQRIVALMFCNQYPFQLEKQQFGKQMIFCDGITLEYVFDSIGKHQLLKNKEVVFASVSGKQVTDLLEEYDDYLNKYHVWPNCLKKEQDIESHWVITSKDGYLVRQFICTGRNQKNIS